jgi:hypothetical protein
MTIPGQLLVGALIVFAYFVVALLVEVVCSIVPGSVFLCAIFAGLAAVALCAIYPTGPRR